MQKSFCCPFSPKFYCVIRLTHSSFLMTMWKESFSKACFIIYIQKVKILIYFVIYTGYAVPLIKRWICFISTNSGHFFFASSKSNVLLKITSKKNITYFQFKSNVVYGFALLTTFSQKNVSKGTLRVGIAANCSATQRKSFLLKSKRHCSISIN